eukprot:6210014-Pleurochrysis_carterae.AAC.1
MELGASLVQMEQRKRCGISKLKKSDVTPRSKHELKNRLLKSRAIHVRAWSPVPPDAMRRFRIWCLSASKMRRDCATPATTAGAVQHRTSGASAGRNRGAQASKRAESIANRADFCQDGGPCPGSQRQTQPPPPHAST